MSDICFKSNLNGEVADIIGFAAIKAVLNGNVYAARELMVDCGEWYPYVDELLDAYYERGSALKDRALRYMKEDARFRALLEAYMQSEIMHEKFLGAAQLLEQAYAPTTFFVPGILPAGLSILAGRPKLGKSWLALQFAAAVAWGESVLGAQAVTRRVFYLALEDSPRRLAERLARQGVGSVRGLDFATSYSPLDSPGIASLGQVLDDGYRFVVIDTFARSLSPQARHNPVRVGQVLERLHKLTVQYNAAILLVDHHRKGAHHSGDPVDDILGGTAKVGVVDAALGLYRTHGDDTATLRVSGRDLGELELRLRWDPTLCCWFNCGDAETLARSERQQEVLDALANLGPATVTALAAYTGQDKGNLFRRLKSLAQSGVIVRRLEHKNIVYKLPDPPPLQPLQQ